MTDPEIHCERRGAAGHVLLDRPKALNALTPGMTRALGRALAAWAVDPGIERVVIRGAGERAFSAGGDIRLLYEQGKAGDHAAQLAFWREEYQINRFIARYPKPYVALMDGLVMGGGAGVSMHGSRRVAGERLVFAMPEVDIGFFPDVGATFVLPRLPGAIGVYLAVSGARIGAGDAMARGLATHFVPSSRFDALADALCDSGDTDAILARFIAPPPPASLARHGALIAAAFASDRPAEVLARLDRAAADGDDFARATATALRAKSPTSVAIALRQMREGRGLSIEDALRLEFRIVWRICRRPDLYEGIRAAIIERGRPPVWSPASFDAVDPADIEAFLAPLGADELDFPAIPSP